MKTRRNVPRIIPDGVRCKEAKWNSSIENEDKGGDYEQTDEMTVPKTSWYWISTFFMSGLIVGNVERTGS